ncbi:MAG: D-isomer specific 2-hydroxyacid dehydrogenase NAD-binding protein [Dactylosporangium sp.]|jgi:phosphoglycerate dehydrogenase-like enzyme|nr:D-isomer specific 2-hydroxyacid dehydrogenase NAD-binding protein [Dactylosporangium sp.]
MTTVVGSTVGAARTQRYAEALGDTDVRLLDIVAGPPAPGAPLPTVLLAAPRRPAVDPGWLTDVRWIHLVSAGIDGYPPGLFSGRLVTGAKGIAAPQLAEWVVHALLTEVKGDLWVDRPYDITEWPARRPRQLADATVGLVGLGEIGSNVARRLLPFGTTVLAVRRNAYAGPVPGVRLLASLDDLIPEVDALVLAAPATAQTRHLIDDAALRSVRPGVHLVNVARGDLVDTDALRTALDDGRIRAATLDVTDPEPLPPGHWLWHHPRVRISPHVAAWAPGHDDAQVARFRDNLDRFRRGGALTGVIDHTVGY